MKGFGRGRNKDIAEVTLDRAGTLARGIGFFARFLLAWPDSTQGFRPFRESPGSWPRLETFHRRMATILEATIALDADSALTPAVISFAPAAKAAWIRHHDEVEEELRAGSELFDVRDVASKNADNAARLAALFQIFEHGTGEVTLEAFASASPIAAWHLNESRRFFAPFALPSAISDAASLDAWLISYCIREHTQAVPVSAVQKAGPTKLRAKTTMEAAAAELEELGRARLERDGHARAIHLNPALFVGRTTAKTAETAAAEACAEVIR